MNNEHRKYIIRWILKALKLLIPAFFYNLLFCIAYLLMYRFQLNGIILLPIIIILYLLYLLFAISANYKETITNKIISFSLFVIMSSPAMIYSLIRVANALPNFFTGIGDQTSWIQFSGSIIGGSMTMFAITFSMKYQNMILKNDRKPKLQCEIQFKGESKNRFRLQDIDSISLFNITNFSMNKIQIVHLTCKVISGAKNDTELLDNKIAEITNNSFCIETIDSYEEDLIKLYFKKNEISIDSNFLKGKWKLSFRFIIKYHDSTEENSYYHDFSFLLIPTQTNLHSVNNKTQDITQRSNQKVVQSDKIKINGVYFTMLEPKNKMILDKN